MDLAQIAQEQGFPAMVDAAVELAASQKPKKVQTAFEAANLAGVQLPIAGKFGAELSLRDPGVMHECRWTGSTIACTAAIPAAFGSASDFNLRCRSVAGSLPLTATPTDVGAGQIGWAIPDVVPCLSLSPIALDVVPTSLDLDSLQGLEAAMAQNEYAAPEIVELSQDQVEDTLRKNLPRFQFCARQDGHQVSGRLLVRYRIGDDGKMAEVAAETVTFDDPVVLACILDKFQQISFPPPRGGFDHGTFPVTFVGG